VHLTASKDALKEKYFENIFVNHENLLQQRKVKLNYACLEL